MYTILWQNWRIKIKNLLNNYTSDTSTSWLDSFNNNNFTLRETENKYLLS